MDFKDDMVDNDISGLFASSKAASAAPAARGEVPAEFAELIAEFDRVYGLATAEMPGKSREFPFIPTEDQLQVIMSAAGPAVDAEKGSWKSSLDTRLFTQPQVNSVVLALGMMRKEAHPDIDIPEIPDMLERIARAEGVSLPKPEAQEEQDLASDEVAAEAPESETPPADAPAAEAPAAVQAPVADPTPVAPVEAPAAQAPAAEAPVTAPDPVSDQAQAPAPAPAAAVAAAAVAAPEQPKMPTIDDLIAEAMVGETRAMRANMMTRELFDIVRGNDGPMISNGDPDLELPTEKPKPETYQEMMARLGVPPRPHRWPDFMAWPSFNDLEKLKQEDLTKDARAKIIRDMQLREFRILARSDEMIEYLRKNNTTKESEKPASRGRQGVHGIMWASLLDENYTAMTNNRVAHWTRNTAQTMDGGMIIADTRPAKPNSLHGKTMRFSLANGLPGATSEAIRLSMVEGMARGWGSFKCRFEPEQAQVALQMAQELGMPCEIKLIGCMPFGRTLRWSPPPPVSDAALSKERDRLVNLQDRLAGLHQDPRKARLNSQAPKKPAGEEPDASKPEASKADSDKPRASKPDRDPWAPSDAPRDVGMSDPFEDRPAAPREMSDAEGYDFDDRDYGDPYEGGMDPRHP